MRRFEKNVEANRNLEVVLKVCHVQCVCKLKLEKKFFFDITDDSVGEGWIYYSDGAMLHNMARVSLEPILCFGVIVSCSYDLYFKMGVYEEIHKISTAGCCDLAGRLGRIFSRPCVHHAQIPFPFEETWR